MLEYEGKGNQTARQARDCGFVGRQWKRKVITLRGILCLECLDMIVLVFVGIEVHHMCICIGKGAHHVYFVHSPLRC